MIGGIACESRVIGLPTIRSGPIRFGATEIARDRGADRFAALAVEHQDHHQHASERAGTDQRRDPAN
jgi:hypothetical protein